MESKSSWHCLDSAEYALEILAAVLAAPPQRNTAVELQEVGEGQEGSWEGLSELGKMQHQGAPNKDLQHPKRQRERGSLCLPLRQESRSGMRSKPREGMSDPFSTCFTA